MCVCVCVYCNFNIEQKMESILVLIINLYHFFFQNTQTSVRNMTSEVAVMREEMQSMRKSQHKKFKQMETRLSLTDIKELDTQ